MKLPLLLAAVLPAALLLAGCQSQLLDADGLPPATQTGANTGGFLLDGEPVVAYAARRQDPVQASQVYRYPDSRDRRLRVKLSWPAPSKRRGYELLGLEIDSVNGPGVYQANTYADNFCGVTSTYLLYQVTEDPYAPYFVTSPTAPGRITITRLDTATHILAGTFEADLVRTKGPGQHRISRGRFDCTYTERKRR